jgi:ubiquinone/menaquinone biosynthesis C-methylase UbiE
MFRTAAVKTVVSALCLLWLLPPTRAADAAADKKPLAHPAEMNKKFVDPNMDIHKFVKKFENNNRGIYISRREIARAVGLKPGDAVADIGAGTGLFTQLFAEQVGPQGIVYAEDIGPKFIEYIAQQAKNQGHEKNVKTVLGTPESANLPAGSVDVVFLCDTYHHFEHPEKMLRSIHRALRPSGRLVLVDFDLRKDSSPFVKGRARATKAEYVREFEAAGFRPIETKEAPKIKDNFYVEFRRVEHRPPAEDHATR